jgi:tRNA (guanine-N7-)-methyltransferase
MTESNDTPIQTEDGDERQHRRIKSFVMRAGRMTEGQQRGLDQGAPLFVLPLADAPVDYDQVFGRSAPRSLEIGFGMGHSLLEMAAAAPEQDFIGVEVHRPGVGALLNGVLTQGLTNLRVYDCDAIEVLNRCVADNSLDRLMLFFPDPWHKSRHHKRRIVQASFAELVRSKLKVGGILHMATDWEPYAEYMLEVMNVAPGYRNLAEDGKCVPRPAERPITKFERRGERLGHGVWDLKFEKVLRSSPVERPARGGMQRLLSIASRLAPTVVLVQLKSAAVSDDADQHQHHQQHRRQAVVVELAQPLTIHGVA